MIGTKQVLKYTFLPQVKPRLDNFLSAGFSNLASFMAMAYRGVRLLPENHPFIQRNATGTYGVMDVLKEASSNLNFSLKNIDQIIVFFALLAGMAMLVLQFVLLLASLMIGTASASGLPGGIGEFFVTENRSKDLALRMLDSVFGVPEIFGTNELTDAAGNSLATTAFHTALHELFQFYSIGLLVIAAIVIAYYIFAIVAETAQTGTPFGKRYNHVWTPIRLVVAIGLLIPLGTGFNSAQWITLYAAKYGSGFATNGWIKFNDVMAESLIDGDELIAIPNNPDLTDIVAFMHIVHSCKQAYAVTEEGDHSDLVKNQIANGTLPANHPKPLKTTYLKDIRAYIVDPQKINKAILLSTVGDPWTNKFVNNQRNIHIRFGEEHNKHTSHLSNVKPYCGEIVVTNNSPGLSGGDAILDAAQVMTWSYFGLIQGLAGVGEDEEGYLYEDLLKYGQSMMQSRLANREVDDPDQTFKIKRVDAAMGYINLSIQAAANALKATFESDTNIEEHGWGGAGIWYNRIANANGLLTSSIMAKPTISKYPSIMEYVCKENKQQNNITSQTDCFDPALSQGKEIQIPNEKDGQIASALSDVYGFWYKDPDSVSGNIFIDTVNLIMGTQGLFDMCRNADVHPLAQLSSTGKGLVDAAIRNIAIGTGTTILGAVPRIGPAFQAASGFFFAIASVGILIGFILYYVIPFMPFLYFFFAVGGWVKGLFEAMVGVPLWALAHLRIDGQGLAGDAAINGYFLIFEIFIRPILIIFGLLASIIIFAAMVKVLNETFSLVVSNLSGFSTANASQCGVAFDGSAGPPTGSIDYLRGPVDEFFFTIVYAILVYMIGMASFKLIDLIPNQILRWMGAGVSTFNDNAGEPAEGLVSKLAIGGGIIGSQLQQAGSAGAQSAKGFIAAGSKIIN